MFDVVIYTNGFKLFPFFDVLSEIVVNEGVLIRFFKIYFRSIMTQLSNVAGVVIIMISAYSAIF
jgi:hypothetical protein